jgi:signal transduction histidine kinase
VAAAREQEQKLAMENAALERVIQLKNELLATLSHELKTPLTVIDANAQLTRKKLNQGYVPGGVDPALEQISAESKRMAALVIKLLNQTKSEIGLSAKQPVRLDELTASTARLFEPMAQNKNIRLEVNIVNDIPPVYGSRDTLEQVLLNLLSNAHSATQKGKIVLSVSHEGDTVTVTVSDTG